MPTVSRVNGCSATRGNELCSATRGRRRDHEEQRHRWRLRVTWDYGVYTSDYYSFSLASLRSMAQWLCSYTKGHLTLGRHVLCWFAFSVQEPNCHDEGVQKRGTKTTEPWHLPVFKI